MTSQTFTKGLSHIFLHVPSWEDAQEMDFLTLPYFNIPNTTNIYVFVRFTGVEEKSPKFQEARDLRSNHFQGGGNDAILPRKDIG